MGPTVVKSLTQDGILTAGDEMTNVPVLAENNAPFGGIGKTSLTKGNVLHVVPRRPQPFLAATSKESFSIGVSSDVEYALLPSLLRQLLIEAPGVSLNIVHTDPSEVSSLLRAGTISLGIAPVSRGSALPYSQTLRTIHPQVLRADTGREPITTSEFCRRPHAGVKYAIDLDTEVVKILGQQGKHHSIVVAVSQFEILSRLLAGSDMLALVPDYVAGELVQKGGLRCEVAPLQNLNFTLSMTWTDATDQDGAHRWLRSRCSMFLADV